MAESEINQIAIAWIRLCHAKTSSQEYEDAFWSFETLAEFCRDQPEDAWKVIVEVYGSHPGEMVLSNLAAGPVEDLLVNHGRLALAWIDQYCRTEPGFVEVLKMVWRNAMPQDVWDELNRLIKK